MRTSTVLAILIAAGCNDLMTLDSKGAAEWTAAHPGVELVSTARVSLVPEHADPIEATVIRMHVARTGEWLRGDVGTARLETPGLPALSPLAVNASLTTLPLAAFEQDGDDTIDFFFPATSQFQPLTFSWTVQTPRASVSLRATLNSDAIIPLPFETTGRWWFAQSVPSTTYRRQDGVVTALPPTSATLGPPEALDGQQCNQW